MNKKEFHEEVARILPILINAINRGIDIKNCVDNNPHISQEMKKLIIIKDGDFYIDGRAFGVDNPVSEV